MRPQENHGIHGYDNLFSVGLDVRHFTGNMLA